MRMSIEGFFKEHGLDKDNPEGNRWEVGPYMIETVFDHARKLRAELWETSGARLRRKIVELQEAAPWWRRRHAGHIAWLEVMHELQNEVAVVLALARYLRCILTRMHVGRDELIRQGVITAEQFETAVRKGEDLARERRLAEQDKTEAAA